MSKKHSNRTVHVSYSLSDKSGLYSKFVGVSMLSMFENTNANVIVHLLHDDTLSDKNRERFQSLAKQYHQKILFYNVLELAKDTWGEAERIHLEGVSSERYTKANMFQFLLPELLPNVNKVIRLDADTVFNIDVQKLWNEKVDTEVGAISDYELLSSFGLKMLGIDKRCSALYEETDATLETAFNAGVTVFRLDLMRKTFDNLLIAGVKLLKEHPKFHFFDNDILIAFFAKTYTHLPIKYNLRLNYVIQYGKNELTEGIYHYVGRNYSLNVSDVRYKLFLDYLICSPWFDSSVFSSVCKTIQRTNAMKVQRRLQVINFINRVCSTKKRVIVGLSNDEKRIRKELFIADDEPFVEFLLDKEKILPYPFETHFHLLFLPYYDKIKNILEKMGYEEFVHFANGMELMPRYIDNLKVDDVSVIYNV